MRKITNMIGRQKITLVFTNQLRQKMNALCLVTHGQQVVEKLLFNSSVRLRLKGMGQIKMKVNGNDKVVGMKVRCQVVKNRMGPPLRLQQILKSILIEESITMVLG